MLYKGWVKRVGIYYYFEIFKWFMKKEEYCYLK